MSNRKRVAIVSAVVLFGFLVSLAIYYLYIRDVQQKGAEMSSMTVSEAVEIFLEHQKANQDEILDALEAAGASPEYAWKLYQFIPVAFAVAIYEPKGVKFPERYISLKASSGERTFHYFNQEPFYLEAFREACSRQAHDGDAERFFSVLKHSAEYDVIIKLSKDSGSLSKIVLTEPICFLYEP